MTTDFIKIESILPDYRDLIGEDTLDSDTYGGISEDVILKWAHDGLGRIHTYSQKVHKIAVIPIEQYRGKLPGGFLYVVQAAYRIDPEGHRTAREQIVQWTQGTLDKSGCKLIIDLECPACHQTECSCETPVVTVDVDRMFEEAHPEYYYGYMKHFYAYGNTFQRGEVGSCYTDQFKLMRRTSNEFYNIPYHIGDCVNFRVNSPVEYDISFPYISTSFKKGEVLLSYISEKTDEKGYRMVPNTTAAIEAVLACIDERIAYRDWRKTKNPQRRVDWLTLDAYRSKKIGQATGELKMPDQDKWKNFLATHWKQSIPFWNYDRSRNLFNPNETDNGYYWANVRPDYNFKF